MDKNLVMLRGRLGQEPEVRVSKNGKEFATFSIATNSKKKNGDEITEWHNCTAFGKTAEIIGKYAFKGCRIAVDRGQLSTDKWTDDSGKKHQRKKVLVWEVEILDRRDSPQETTESVEIGSDDDDLPF